MPRVSVSLSDELLQAIDAQAVASHTNRSALIRSALTAYLEERRTEREEAEIRREMEAAGRGMDTLARKLGNWDPVSVIRGFRDGGSVSLREPG